MTDSYNYPVAASSNARLDNLVMSLSLNLAAEGQRALERASGLTGSATAALLALEEFLSGAHVGRLADVLGLTHSGAVRLVTQLERNHLAQRHESADRRRVEVSLTTTGKRRALEARAARDEVIASATSGLNVDESQTLEALLDKLISARITSRIEESSIADNRAWWCRTCNFAACGRPEGRCPAQATAAKQITQSDR